MRFTIRTLLIVVAAAAVLLAAERTRRRWVYFRQQAAIHGGLQSQFERDVRVIKAELVREERFYSGLLRPNGNYRRELDAMRELAVSRAEEAAHHARLKEDYLRRW